MITTLLGALTVVSVNGLGVGVSLAIESAKPESVDQLALTGRVVNFNDRPIDRPRTSQCASSVISSLCSSTGTLSSLLQGLVMHLA